MTAPKRGRGRPRGEPHTTRSIRLPCALWATLEVLAQQKDTTINAVVHALCRGHDVWREDWEP